MSRSLRDKLKEMLPRNFLIRQLDQRAKDCVLLTFDDGPHPDVTPGVLSRLEDYKAQAVFFAVGKRIEKAPFLLRKIKERGHEIGNHTYIHSNSKPPWFLAYWKDLLNCQSIIEQYTGERPGLFRPPRGHISPTSLVVPKLVGLKTVNWSLGVKDWRCRTSNEARHAAEKLVHKIKPRDIVLLHDDNPCVLEILDIILPAIHSRGYDLFAGKNFLY